jgi:hypothetical protein
MIRLRSEYFPDDDKGMGDTKSGPRYLDRLGRLLAGRMALLASLVIGLSVQVEFLGQQPGV